MNILIDTFNTVLNQAIATAVAEAIKPLQNRITALEEAYTEAYTDWKGMEHVAAKAVQPLQDRITALEINQTLVKTEKEEVVDTPLGRFDVHGQNELNEAIRNVLDGYNFVNRNEVVDLVTGLVDDAIENHDFSDSIDWDNKIEEGISNYDFSDIIEENLPDLMSEDTVQGMIDDALSSLVGEDTVQGMIDDALSSLVVVRT